MGFACLGVGAVAVEASVRENRPDLSLKIDGRCGNIGGRELRRRRPDDKTSRIPSIRSPPQPIFEGLIMVKAFVRSRETLGSIDSRQGPTAPSLIQIRENHVRGDRAIS